jgi:class 3 adenylate cyclase
LRFNDHDGVDLRLRVGVNSGQVIAGEIGSGALGYTAVGEQVGIAQRMESVAPPGAVMLSASTARLVDGIATLGEVEHVRIKGNDQPVGRGHAIEAVGLQLWCGLVSKQNCRDTSPPSPTECPEYC